MKLTRTEGDYLLQEAYKKIKNTQNKKLGKVLWDSLPPQLQEHNGLTEFDFRFWRDELRVKQCYYLYFVEED